VITQPGVGDGVGVLKWLTLNVSVGAAGGGVDPPPLPKRSKARRISEIVTRPDPIESQVNLPLSIAFITITSTDSDGRWAWRVTEFRAASAFSCPVARDGGTKKGQARGVESP
jgi:hypothetical protein